MAQDAGRSCRKVNGTFPHSGKACGMHNVSAPRRERPAQIRPLSRRCHRSARLLIMVEGMMLPKSLGPADVNIQAAPNL